MGSDVGGCVITDDDALDEKLRFVGQSRGAVATRERARGSCPRPRPAPRLRPAPRPRPAAAGQPPPEYGPRRLRDR
jgi:hypothetical protein